MGDVGDAYKGLREWRKELRAKFGVECADCRRLLPMASPSILLPGWKCKMHPFRAPENQAYEDYLTEHAA